ncbi:FG-GAP-like repeat-containing protein [Dapis sp. BLCC M229]|uniref:FG-GAP-like repeat-containing protein n=1 Tax=Dapis sp. BLCC M229 TaxID=3400188 RepID=UPI003CF9658B
MYLNDGSGNFSSTTNVLGSNNSFSVSLGDVDGDGDIDAVFANYDQANRVYLNDGSGNFSSTTNALGSYASEEVSLGDVDGDGDIDTVFANNNQANRVYLNDGSGNFSSTTNALGSNRSFGVSLGDVDGDGALDAVFANTSNSGRANTVYLNGSDTSGSVSGSYIFDSTVFFDGNFNQLLDAGEPFTSTDAYGRFVLPLAAGFDLNNNGQIDLTEGQLVSIGGTDSSSGLPAGTLIALAGASIISPLTTLEAAVFNQGLSQDDADALIQNQLGLDLAIDLAIDLDQFDPLAAVGEGSEAGLQVYIAHINTQALFNQARSFLDGLEAADPDVPVNENNLEQVLFTLAELLVENEQAGTTFDISDDAQLTVFFERLATNNGVAASEAQLDGMAQIVTESIEYLDEVTLDALSADDATPASTLPVINAVKRLVQGDVSAVAQQLGAETLTPTEAAAELNQLITQELVLVGDGINTIGNRTVSLTSPIDTLNEDAGTISVDIELSDPAPNQGLNLFFTVEGTATGGDDFTIDTSTRGQFIVAPNETTATLDISIVDDALTEDTETLTITLETATEGFAIDADSQSITLEIQDNDPLVGDDQPTKGDDILVGTDRRDRIKAGKGADTIFGLGGNDDLLGGQGDDTLLGGAGKDLLVGNNGDDLLDGGEGKDRLFGNKGDDSLFGGAGKDLLVGNKGDDLLDGGAGKDTYLGGKGADTFVLRLDEGVDVISDFDIKDGDIIQLSGGLSVDDLTITPFRNKGATLSVDGEDIAILRNGGFENITPDIFTEVL